VYSSKGFQNSELGDIEVVEHNNMFHLFHLVLPNHDYIAHAVSSDGFLWRRTKNALFIGEPGDWDDDMLWTMHISPDPDGPAAWRMFYTGIARKEVGRVQRIGLARSFDLYYWEKVASTNYPLSITGPHYEESLEEGRNWVSCRDPFFYNDGKERLLLVNARIPYDPLIRRGCIGLAREVETDHFEWQEPLFFPRMYDDIEVPGLLKLEDKFYLFGNIKKDIKVHYWHSDSLCGKYEAFSDNVLLPRGNFAARFTQQDKKVLLWNFFNANGSGASIRILPPPVELKVADDNTLFIKSYSGFNEKVVKKIKQKDFLPMRRILKNPTASLVEEDNSFSISCESGYEIFLAACSSINFRLRFKIRMKGIGKTGILFRSDDQANSYYISLDLINGLAQGRLWGVRTEGYHFEKSFQYMELQQAPFKYSSDVSYLVEIISFGGYFELSIEGKVILRFVDTTYMFHDKLGFYVESANINISDLTLDFLNGPEEEDHSVI
jgi:beta-fructofuranosidase